MLFLYYFSCDLVLLVTGYHVCTLVQFGLTGLATGLGLATPQECYGVASISQAVFVLRASAPFRMLGRSSLLLIFRGLKQVRVQLLLLKLRRYFKGLPKVLIASLSLGVLLLLVLSIASVAKDILVD